MMYRDYDQVDISFLCRVDNFITRDAVTELDVTIWALWPELLLQLILEGCGFLHCHFGRLTAGHSQNLAENASTDN